MSTPGRKRTIETTIERSKALLESGIGIEDIAKQLGKKPSTIKAYLRQAGIKFPRKAKYGKTLEWVPIAKKLREDGKTLQEISEQVGRTKQAVFIQLGKVGRVQKEQHYLTGKTINDMKVIGYDDRKGRPNYSLILVECTVCNKRVGQPKLRVERGDIKRCTKHHNITQDRYEGKLSEYIFQ